MTVDRVEELLADLATLLNQCGEERWGVAVEELARRLRDDTAPSDAQDILRDVLGMYGGGAGGFQDVVLQRRGAVLADQDRFSRLRSRLFEAARTSLAPG